MLIAPSWKGRVNATRISQIRVCALSSDLVIRITILVWVIFKHLIIDNEFRSLIELFSRSIFLGWLWGFRVNSDQEYGTLGSDLVE